MVEDVLGETSEAVDTDSVGESTAALGENLEAAADSVGDSTAAMGIAQTR